MYQVDETLCTGCGTCLESCPVEAVQIVADRAQIIQELCVECGACAPVCPEGAIVTIVQPAQVSAAAPRPEPAPSTPDRSREIITVQVPPPPAEIAPAPSLAQRLLPAVGTAIAFVGREIVPRIVRLATDMLEQRLARPADSTGERSPPGAGGAGQRRRRRRRGNR